MKMEKIWIMLLLPICVRRLFQRTMTTTWGNAPRWFELSVSLSLDATGQQVLVASIDGTIVAHGVVSLGGGSGGEAYANPFVAASYSTAAGNNATKSDSPAVRSHSLPAFLPACYPDHP